MPSRFSPVLVLTLVWTGIATSLHLVSPSHTMTSELRVSICGGGIGGLTLALVLGKYGAPLPAVEIFEAAPTITTIGAGIALFERATNLMKDLGLYDELVKMAASPPQENTGRPLTVHRKDVIEFLLRQIPTSCKIHTSKRLEFYDIDPDTGDIMLHFADSSTFVTGILVRADGIRSATRKTMYKERASSTRDKDTRKEFQECVNPIWTGTLLYRSLVPTEKIMKKYPDFEQPTTLTFHLGRNKHIIVYPISQGKLLNVVIHFQNRSAFGTPFEGRWVTHVSEEEIVNQFEDWEERARAYVECTEMPSRWALHSLRLLPRYVDSKVVLLGDAAHAMEPHLGAGAGQAIEDAFALGRLLTHKLTNRVNIMDGLKIYEEVRLPIANNVLWRALDAGRCYGFQHLAENNSTSFHDGAEELDHIHKLIDAWEWHNEPGSIWADAEERWHMKCGVRTAKL